METGSKIDRLVIGARGLKDHLGWYLLQGLVASVFLHSAVMTLVGMWPSGDKSRGREIVIIVDNPPKRQPDSPVNPVPARLKPKPPLKPDIKGLIPVDDEPMVIDHWENGAKITHR
ncbi:MAG: hypothetical protein IPP40_00480 [bacterium]|nr:hypothetical protein [bacterium]